MAPHISELLALKAKLDGPPENPEKDDSEAREIRKARLEKVRKATLSEGRLTAGAKDGLSEGRLERSDSKELYRRPA